MILYELQCSAEHRFEAWFKDSAAYDRQAKRGLVICPVCADTKIAKAPMAPRITGKGKAQAEEAGHMMQALRAIRETVEANCEHVGPRFPEEARRIHYGEAEKRGIYGDATKEEAKSLKDEGIEIAAIPWLPRQDS
ncbi:MAG: DUF1178 family protein [Rhodospirillales bacterium]|nr:DUF1178 family protein [Rhodospirillales bacterium]